MSNVTLDRIADRNLNDLTEKYGKTAVANATNYLKENGLVWWDYWNFEYNSIATEKNIAEINKILGVY